jgi:hypothetical protein
LKFYKNHIRFEVLRAVVRKSLIFGDITQYSVMKVNLRSLGTYRLLLQGRRINQARNQDKAGSRQQAAGSRVTFLAACFMLVCYLA